MAALTMTPATMRQPFASLDAPRMRSLLKTKLNVKNQQNGASITGKRRPLGEIDTENVDPTLNLSTKRKRGSDEDGPVKGSSKPIKASRKALATVEPIVAPRTPSAPISAPPSTPKSTTALKPAGRSPKSKSQSCKPFARRSNISKNRSEPTGKKTVSRPFSIATALSNGKSKQPSSKAPASWAFEIHVDSEQEEMTNLMQHSTGVLDISDDETKVENTSRGKENIPPADLGLSLPASPQQESTAAAARKGPMMEESRSPLGELNASDYYGADCHAFSYEVVYDDDAENTPEPKKAPAPSLPRSTQPSRSSKLSSVSSISSILEATTPATSTDEPSKENPSEAEIKIWESGSAAEEQSEATSTQTEPLGL
ncbi:hypothetical protein MW887_007581 [Aspergillus wentii]|nr:hypothetical protein MW887_007581 [Aspergillus wentii]